jgi:hypothetical protein
VSRVGKATLLVALLLFLASLVLALVPVKATAAEYLSADSEPRVVNCGSFPFRTKWSGDAGCDRARTRRITQTGYVFIVALGVGSVGGALLVAGRRLSPGTAL